MDSRPAAVVSEIYIPFIASCRAQSMRENDTLANFHGVLFKRLDTVPGIALYIAIDSIEKIYFFGFYFSGGHFVEGKIFVDFSSNSANIFKF